MTEMELLAPAGTMENLKTAVQFGADAVYFGCTQFSARAHAGNFTLDEAKEAIQYLHAHGVRAHVALNTLLRNEEFETLVKTVSSLAEYGADAFIVQDLGVAYLVRECLPEIGLHASTQMVVHNREGLQQLEEWGFTRAVLARETGLEDLIAMQEESPLELEVFVHGAQCVCYSGACLMSSMQGGRSGNRGDCAQPCRRTYTLYQSDGTPCATEGRHLLSPRDMDLLPHLPELSAAGVASLKIEGRMKNAAYVAATTGAYRRILDAMANREALSPERLAEERSEMARIFNRGGAFTSGYLKGNPGKDLMFWPTPKNLGVPAAELIQVCKGIAKLKLTVPVQTGDGYVIYDAHYTPLAGGYINGIQNAAGQGVKSASPGELITIDTGDKALAEGAYFYRTYEHALNKRLSKESPCSSQERAIPLDFYPEARLGEPLRLTAVARGTLSATVESAYHVEEATRKATSEEVIRTQLGRLGDTPFTLGSVVIAMDENVFIPVSVLNALRRAGVEKVSEQLPSRVILPPEIRAEEKEACQFEHLDRIPPRVEFDKPRQLSAQVATPNQAEAALDGGCDRLILNLTGYRSLPAFSDQDLAHLVTVSKSLGTEVVMTWSGIWNQAQGEALRRDMSRALDAGITVFSAQNPGHIPLAKTLGFTSWEGDIGLNVSNDVAIHQLMNSGCNRVILSPELALADIQTLSFVGNMKTGGIVYGDIPLMQSEYCLPGAALGHLREATTCSSPCQYTAYYIENDEGRQFDLMQDRFCRMYVFDRAVLDGIQYQPEILATGLDEWRFLFLRHHPEEIKDVLRSWQHACAGENIPSSLSDRPRTLGHLLQGVKR